MPAKAVSQRTWYQIFCTPLELRSVIHPQIVAATGRHKDALLSGWFLKYAYRLPTDSRNKKAAFDKSGLSA